jgi:hypothetical protein
MSKKNKDAAMRDDAESVTDEERTEGGEESTDLVTRQTEAMANLGVRALDIEGMSDDEQMTELEKLLDCRPEEIEAIATGRLPFWPAMAGQLIHGVLVGQREVPTRFGTAKLYTLNLKRPAVAQTLDGEIFELPAGENISVLERVVLKELAMREGQEVGILCVGKKRREGAKFAYWDYKIVGRRQSPAEVQAAAQKAMARMQMRALPQATAQKG